MSGVGCTSAATLLVSLAVVAGGCDMGTVEPSLLGGPQVLAARTVPRSASAGAPLTLDAWSWAGEGPPSWQACAAPWQATGSYAGGDGLTCPAGAIALGDGAPLDVTWPSSLAGGGWARLDLDGAVPAVLEVGAWPDLPHPEVAAIVGPAGAPLPTVVAPGQALDLGLETVDPLGAGLSATWFTTAGAIDPWHTAGDGGPTLEVPDDAAGALDVLVVVRDGAGGVGWASVTIALEGGR